MTRYLLFVSRAYSFEILRPLAAAASRRGAEVRWFVHGVEPPASLPRDQLLTDVAGVARYAPQAVFAPGNWVPDFFPGVKVQVFHGFGIDKKGHFAIRGFFDLYCTHGPLTTSRFEALRRRYGHFAVRETGWPKMDPLFTPSDIARRLRGSDDRPIVLFAPTFSPALSGAASLLDAIAAAAAGGSWRWLVKFHPRMDPALIARYRELGDAGVEIRDGDDILPLLQAADVLLSDTSSVVAEFLIQDKPAVTFHSRNPGAHVMDFTDAAQLDNTIAAALQRPPALMRAAHDYVQAMHPYRDGRCSERVLAAVDEFVRDGTARSLRRKPLNLKRRLQVRHRMRYYRWR